MLRARVPLAILLAFSACHAAERRPASIPSAETPSKGALSALGPLDESHAADLRRAFDEAKDRPRYIVALSPT